MIGMAITVVVAVLLALWFAYEYGYAQGRRDEYRDGPKVDGRGGKPSNQERL